MAVIQTDVTGANNIRDFIGLSTDTKPTVDGNGKPFGAGSTFWELNTKAAYIFSAENVNPDTGNGWWPV